MQKEIKIVSDIYTDVHSKMKNGKVHNKEILIKKDAVCKKIINTEDIISISEVFNNKGNILKSRCKINIKSEGEYLVDESYKDTVNYLYNLKLKKIGF